MSRSIPPPLYDAEFIRRITSTPVTPALHANIEDTLQASYAPADAAVTLSMTQRLAGMESSVVEEEEVEFFDPASPVPMNGVAPPTNGEVLFDLDVLRRLHHPDEPDDPSLDIDRPNEPEERHSSWMAGDP